MGHSLTSKICPVCGKSFIKAALSIYHLQIDGKSYQFCSYKCYDKVLTWKEARTKERRKNRGKLKPSDIKF